MLRLAVLGDPVEHSLSPRMQSAAMKEMGIEGEYIAIRVGAEDFVRKIDQLRAEGFRGANVTIPHKSLARGIARPADDASEVLQVANTLMFEDAIRCKNTDAPGFMDALGDLHPGRALILGSGGAAAAAIWSLSIAGWSVKVWSRTFENAANAAKWEHTSPTAIADPTGCSLVVNATPLGLEPGEFPPADWDRLQAGATVFDMAYRDGPTDLLEFVRSRGHPAIDGREMLVAQGALSLEWWTGRPAPRDAMRASVGLPPKE